MASKYCLNHVEQWNAYRTPRLLQLLDKQQNYKTKLEKLKITLELEKEKMVVLKMIKNSCEYQISTLDAVENRFEQLETDVRFFKSELLNINQSIDQKV